MFDENNNNNNTNGNNNNYNNNDYNYNNSVSTDHDQYNNNNMNGMYGNYNFTNENFEQKRAKKKKHLRVAAIVVGAVVLAGTSGVIGGVATYKVLSKTNTTTVSSTSYAAPEFTSASDGSLTVSEAFEKVKPAVVTISTKSIQQSYGSYSQEVDGLGSGFIINEDGYILTNNHVVEGSSEVTVLLSNGQEVSAKVVNTDAEEDLAMIKLADGTQVPGVAELGDSDALYPGEDVIAIGTPLSKEFAQTLTKGIVSAVNREVQSESGTTIKVIQTDAAINAGNSGGPLINTKGQVIGINSMKMGSSTTSSSEASVEGMGFSIPINDAKSRIDTLSKPDLSLGISVKEIDADTAKQSGYPQGLYVASVTDFSPASKGGMQVGDVIVKFDGTEIKTYEELKELKSKKNAGDTVSVTVSRNGKEVDLQVELQEK